MSQKESVTDFVFKASDYQALRDNLASDNILLRKDETMNIESIEKDGDRRYIQTNGGRFNENTILAYSFIEVGDATKALQNAGDETLECVNTKDEKNLVRVIDWFAEHVGEQFRLPAEMKVSQRYVRGANKLFMENESRKHVYKNEGIYELVSADDKITHVPVLRKDMQGKPAKSTCLIFKAPSPETIAELKVVAEG